MRKLYALILLPLLLTGCKDAPGEAPPPRPFEYACTLFPPGCVKR